MHIVLHPTHITSMQPGGRPPRVDKLQKLRVLAFPLDQVLIMQAGDTPHCEVTLIGNLSMSWICAELWGDVLAALEQGRGSGSIARVPLTDAIVEGIRAEPTLAEQIAADLRDRSFKGKPQEGTRSNPIRPTLRKTAAHDVDGESREVTSLAHEGASATVTLPLPASSREVQPGDLRITNNIGSYKHYIRVAEQDGDGNLVWTQDTLKAGLRGGFATFAEAAQAIRVAGLAHRLIDEEPGAA